MKKQQFVLPSNLQFGLPSIDIPSRVLFNYNLSSTEKVLFGFIESLSSRKNGCSASNKYLAGLLGATERTISNSISSLIKYGYIKRTSFDGRTRILKINKD